ncbi:hypothetical protein GCM10010109_64660 [Actinoplanes campanulatus]|nr:hypothetical protein GCM10010109_64660 [Actinoplanes campanulatus]GID39688.1 hypothetical protein Aca09nite_61940 [Actinoplanes campanulatus]
MRYHGLYQYGAVHDVPAAKAGEAPPPTSAVAATAEAAITIRLFFRTFNVRSIFAMTALRQTDGSSNGRLSD